MGSSQVGQEGHRVRLMLTDLKVGRVGDCVPPPGLVADLKSFDPSLRMLWNRDEQCWTVVQRVRRSRVVGEMDDGAIREVHDVDRPVLYLSDLTGDPDRRIIAQLFRQRLAGKKQRLERAKRRISEAKRPRRKSAASGLSPPAKDWRVPPMTSERADSVGLLPRSTFLEV